MLSGNAMPLFHSTTQFIAGIDTIHRMTASKDIFSLGADAIPNIASTLRDANSAVISAGNIIPRRFCNTTEMRRAAGDAPLNVMTIRATKLDKPSPKTKAQSNSRILRLNGILALI